MEQSGGVVTALEASYIVPSDELDASYIEPSVLHPDLATAERDPCHAGGDPSGTVAAASYTVTDA